MCKRLRIAALATCLLVALPVLADWDEGEPAKWVQMPDLTPMGIDVNASVIDRDYILADDWECTATERITNIHIWGSWYHDILPQGSDPYAVEFTLSIHADIPAEQSPTGYSMPGEMLWMHHFPAGTFEARRYAVEIVEGWMDPPDLYEPIGDWTCWQYNFTMPADNVFEQLGTPDEPIVYWLDVKAVPMDDAARFGWKTSIDHWNDNAVWGEGPEPYFGPWYELIYPPGHEYMGQPIDLAFVLQGEPMEEELDYGDVPDSYRTLLASDGARHVLTAAGPYLGGMPDIEFDGLPTPGADGDDLNNIDDEDGIVWLTPLSPGNTAQVQMIVSGGGQVDGWIDFDYDGVFNDATERIVGTWFNAGMHVLNVTVPASTPLGSTYARFRINSDPTGTTLLPYGWAADGEVEDYKVAIVEEEVYKYEQLPDLTPTGIDVECSNEYVLADDFPCTVTGPITDIEIFGSWLDDYIPFGEDPLSVTFQLSFHADIPVGQVGNDYSMPGELLWLYEFAPGSFDARIYADQLQEGWMRPPDEYWFPADTICWLYHFHIPEADAFIQQGTPDAPVVYWLDVKAIPADQSAVFGWKTSEIHWNDDSVWGQGDEPYAGPWFEMRYPPTHELAGESIDLAFRLNGQEIEPTNDWGDAPHNYPVLAANLGATHVIVPGYHLGTSIDAELDGQPDPNALGDDNDGNDDEDGVVFGNLRPGKSSTVAITATGAGFVELWIDYNADGDWADANEQVLSAAPVVAGANAFTFNVPLGAAQNTLTYARVRFSSVGGLPFTGPAIDGEVEDYQVELLDKYVVKWHQDPDLTPMGIDVNASVSFRDYVLADDFLCTSTGPLTDIHVFGSWLGDYLPFGEDPLAVHFTLSFHADIPAEESPTGYSMPGEVLWVSEFEPGTFKAEPFAIGLEEGWLNAPDDYIWPADTVCWEYAFHVDPHMAFIQRGTEEEPIVYWLDVKAQVLDGEALFGWKTSLTHWNDDAVWGEGAEPYPGPWNELRYPPGHELMGQSIDLAFTLMEDTVTPVPDDEPSLPQRSELRQNVPNPFNPQTEIKYVVPTEGGRVRLEIFDVMGRRVRTLVDQVQSGGERSVMWNGCDDSGRSLPTGIYVYRLRAAGADLTQKMLLLR